MGLWTSGHDRTERKPSLQLQLQSYTEGRLEIPTVCLWLVLQPLHWWQQLAASCRLPIRLNNHSDASPPDDKRRTEPAKRYSTGGHYCLQGHCTTVSKTGAKTIGQMWTQLATAVDSENWMVIRASVVMRLGWPPRPHRTHIMNSVVSMSSISRDDPKLIRSSNLSRLVAYFCSSPRTHNL